MGRAKAKRRDEELSQLATRVPQSVRKALKVLSLQSGCHVQFLVEAAIREALTRKLKVTKDRSAKASRPRKRTPAVAKKTRTKPKPQVRATTPAPEASVATTAAE